MDREILPVLDLADLRRRRPDRGGQLMLRISWMAPDRTPASQRLAAYYNACIALGQSRPA
jgi:hypothetical protein